MNLSVWRWIKELNRLLSTRQPEPVRQAERIAAMQLHVVLPAKAGVIAVALYYISHHGSFAEEETNRGVAVDWLGNYFVAFLIVNFIALFLFVFWRKLPPGLFPWLAFTLGLLDGLFVAGLMFITEGFESIMFWVFPGLIVLNALRFRFRNERPWIPGLSALCRRPTARMPSRRPPARMPTCPSPPRTEQRGPATRHSWWRSGERMPFRPPPARTEYPGPARAAVSTRPTSLRPPKYRRNRW
jgi:hypothetical protein